VFNSSQMALLNTQISVANGKGIGVRYWDTPGVSSLSLRDYDGGGGSGGGSGDQGLICEQFPISTRNRIWTTLWNAGVSLVNVDDLVAGAGLADLGNFWEMGAAIVSG